MTNISKIRTLLETIRYLAPHLTDEEISEIGKVLNKATERLIKESEV